jgi:hypothetical protein
VFFIIGVNDGAFIYSAAAVIIGVDLKGYFALAPGRDLPRIRDSRAPSVRSDALDLKKCCPIVLNNKIVGYLFSFDNRFKFEMNRRHISRGQF